MKPLFRFGPRVLSPNGVVIRWYERIGGPVHVRWAKVVS